MPDERDPTETLPEEATEERRQTVLDDEEPADAEADAERRATRSDSDPGPLGPALRGTARHFRKTARRIAGEALPDLQAGARPVLGRYELGDMLGQGGCGAVFQGRDLRHERDVAVKVLYRADERARKRFEREIRATARLNHPALVPLLDSGAEGGDLYLVMELVEGRSLAEHCGEASWPDERPPGDPLAPPALATVMRDVAEAIHFAHERGILHRDLKPHNVIVDRHGHGMVLDFGLALIEDRDSRMTRPGAAVGTPSYMPPEQASGSSERAIDARSDVYALGATLYHALAGQAPFDDSGSGEELFARIMAPDPVPPPSLFRADVPYDLETICLKCLEKDPARRYATAAEVAAELGRFLHGEPILASRLSAAGRALRWTERNRLAAGLVAALAVALAALAAVSVLYWQAVRG